MDVATAVKIAGITIVLIGTALCLALARIRRHTPPYKWLAPFILLAFPLAAIGVGNYHLLEGTQEVASCLRCHVMTPIANDMMDPESMTLAARHYKNRWIATRQCSVCHKDYGLGGTIKAKKDGLRHLVKYILRTYEEPIQFVGRFDNQNCLQCHRETSKFEAVKSHQTLRERLEESRTTCTTCHGLPHPTSLERTPGTARYEELLHR